MTLAIMSYGLTITGASVKASADTPVVVVDPSQFYRSTNEANGSFSCSITPSGGANDLVVQSTSYSGNALNVVIASGVPGVTYMITVVVTMPSGQQTQASFPLFILANAPAAPQPPAYVPLTTPVAQLDVTKLATTDPHQPNVFWWNDGNLALSKG